MVFEIEFEWYFSDGHVGHAEQLAGFTVEETLQISVDRIARNLFHNAWKIGGSDVHLVGIEIDLTLLSEVVRCQMNKDFEDVFLVFHVVKSRDGVAH